MPFSRYQIRNEFSLADPELYKAADKDDPEALLEGVAMAGLVGVLRQLGDLAEFAAEIFHGLHEEVMVTATRGHGLLVRVQQLESDFPSIERAFLSQTGHSPFFSSPGVAWHPNLRTEENLITKGDLPRFVMDSYEECRPPPRLFLLDKFDMAGAGACLKRYTDPSFFKVEASSYEMTNAEAQRDKKTRKTKKKGSQWKNGNTPEAFQPSHVKLHQLLLEERIQNGASEPAARNVKLKKRQTKFPFDMENGKGYMEKLLSPPPEDKLVHEVLSVGVSPTDSSRKSALEIHSVDQSTSQHESPTVDKMVSMEHTLQPGGAHSEIEEEIKEKHISVDGYESNDVASEADDYEDALATMESEIETDAELRANSDPTVKSSVDQLQLQSSGSQSASDDESSSNQKKITSFSYSDGTTSSNSVDDKSPPRGIESSEAFARIEIPFRPRVSALDVDQGVVIKENNSKDSEISLNNCVDVNSENPSSTLFVGSSQCEDDSALVISHAEDDLVECKPDPSEAGISDSDEDETELKDREAVSVDSDSKDATASVCDPVDDIDEDNNSLSISEGKEESKERETESISSDVTAAISDPDDANINENKDLSTCENTEADFIDSEAEVLEKNEDLLGVVQNSHESIEKKDLIEMSSVLSPELDSVSSYDHSNTQFLDGNHNSSPATCNELTENASAKMESGEKEEMSQESVISLELDSILSSFYDQANIQTFDTFIPTSSLDTSGDLNEDDNSNSSANLKILQEETFLVAEKPDQIGMQTPDLDGVQFVDSSPGYPVSTEDKSGSLLDIITTMPSESVSPNQVDHIENLEGASLMEREKAEQSQTESFLDLDSQNNVDANSEPNVVNEQDQETQDHVDYKTSFLETNESLVPDSEELNLPQSDEIHYPLAPGFSILPQLAPINLEEMPPLPPLPPMQWRMGIKPQNASLVSRSDDGQQVNSFPSFFPRIQNEETPNKKGENEVLPIESSSPPITEDGSSVISSQVNASLISRPDGGQQVNSFPSSFPTIEAHPSLDTDEKTEIEKDEITSSSHIGEDVIVPQPPFNGGQSTSSVVSGDDDERPNGIRPMKVQRPRTPLIDAVAAHDKSKLRKVSERAMPVIPKEEEKDTLLEQIRAKSFNLKPAVQTRPSIQGPTTNLRVAAILEKANAIRMALAGSDDDEDGDDDDGWSDS